MLPTTQRKTIDYDAIYTGLMETVELYSNEDIKRCRCNEIQALKEFRTIGLTAPRQCGKTQWIIDKLNQDPNTSILFRNNPAYQIAKHQLVNVDESRIFTPYDVIKAKVAIADGSVDYEVVKTKIIFVDDAFYTIDYIGRDVFYKWLAASPAAKDLIIVMVG